MRFHQGVQPTGVECIPLECFTEGFAGCIDVLALLFPELCLLCALRPKRLMFLELRLDKSLLFGIAFGRGTTSLDARLCFAFT